MSYPPSFNSQNNSMIESCMSLLTITEKESMNVTKEIKSTTFRHSMSRSKSYKLDLVSLASQTTQESSLELSKPNNSSEYDYFIDTPMDF
mmetsp:Transcript_4966/g.5761  ORF Transcript_4966/g.5761 Transcript_4966/m.5761 type:complete len:90 (-) Transcript_4966:164-433(-)